MRPLAHLLALTAVSAACVGTPQAVPDSAAPAAALDAAPTALRAPVIGLSPGDPVGFNALGLACTAWPDNLRYADIRTEVALADLERVLARRAAAAGLVFTNDPFNIFRDVRTRQAASADSASPTAPPADAGDGTAPDGDATPGPGRRPEAATATASSPSTARDRGPADGRRYELGARVATITADLCPQVDFWSGEPDGSSGSLALTVDWQLYDHRAQRVVHAVTTTGSAALAAPDERAVALLTEAAFAAAADRMLADVGLRARLAAGAQEEEAPVLP